MATEGKIQLQPDGAGQNVRNVRVKVNVDGTLVTSNQQVVSLASAEGEIMPVLASEEAIQALIDEVRRGSRTLQQLLEVQGRKLVPVATRSFFAFAAPTSGASNFAQVILFNPAGSGVLVILDVLHLGQGSAGAAAAYISRVTAGVGAQVPTQMQNAGLIGPGPSPVAQDWSNTTAATTVPTNTFFEFVMGPSFNPTVTYDKASFYIYPGNGWAVTCGVVSAQLLASLHWREVPLSMTRPDDGFSLDGSDGFIRDYVDPDETPERDDE